jgi:hypothetical protein
MTFKAMLAARIGEAISTRMVETNEQDLMPGDVTNFTTAFIGDRYGSNDVCSYTLQARSIKNKK